MKICPRYLSPKSPFSERGLTIASLKLYLYKFYFMFGLLGVLLKVVWK